MSVLIFPFHASMIFFPAYRVRCGIPFIDGCKLKALGIGPYGPDMYGTGCICEQHSAM
jgi:hypothetical protein